MNAQYNTHNLKFSLICYIIVVNNYSFFLMSHFVPPQKITKLRKIMTFVMIYAGGIFIFILLKRSFRSLVTIFL